MDFDLTDLISRAQNIIESLPTSSDVEKIENLQDLAEIFIYAGPELLSVIDSKQLILTLINCFRESDDNEVLDFSSTCMVNFIDTFDPRPSIFLRNDIIPLFAEKFDKGLSLSVTGNCIKIIKFLVENEPQLIGTQFGVLRLLRILDTLRTADQRSAMHCISSMYGYNLTPEIAEYIPKLCLMLNSTDKFLQKRAVASLSKMIPAMSDNTYKKEMMDPLQFFVMQEEDLSSLESILGVMSESSKKVSFAQLIIDCKFDFSRCLSEQFANKNKEIPNKVLNLLLNIFPPAEFPPDYWDKPHDLANGLKEYSEQVVKYALPFLEISNGNEKLLLALLCVCQRLSPFDYPPGIFPKISSILQDLSLPQFVLLFALTANPKFDPLIVSSGIFTQLKDNRPKEQKLTKWYEDNIVLLSMRIGSNFKNIFDGKEFNTFEELIHFLESNKFTPFEFEEANIAEKALNLLRNTTKYDSSDDINPNSNDLKLLLDICKQMIANTPAPCPTDICNDHNPNDFAQGMLNLQVVLEGEFDQNITIRYTGLFVSIEAWYNRDVKNMPDDAFISANQELANIIQIEHPDRLSLTEVGILNRAFKTPGYKKFKYRMNGIVYSYLDFLFQSFVRSLDKPSDYQTVVPKIELIEEDENESDNLLLINTLKTPDFDVSKTTKLLDLISLIHEKCPKFDFLCPELEKRLRRQTTFYNTVGRFTPASRLVPKYPFIFSQDFRLILYKLTSLDLFSSLSVANATIFKRADSLLEGKMHFMCRIRRDNIFEDGIKLLNSVGPGCVQFDISFDDEPGFGSGPMHEFIALMSTEFSKKSRQMWRNVKESTDGIVVGENGYFPAPNADPELFYTLGILCGKALQAGIPVPIPFNTEFFKLLRDEPVDLKRIDLAFYNSLKPANKEGFLGLYFVYPGIDTMELIPNGSNIEVTNDNVDDYINYVEKFTIDGPQIKRIRNRFLDGFHKIVLGDMEKSLLSAEEMNYLISGDKISVSMEDLMENIILEHGYDSNSPEIKMLFEAILEMNDEDRAMFFKFITGTDRLPIGGLSNLSPKVKVAKRVLEYGQRPDDALPTVSTCSYYFKMPAYSNKETLMKKIKIAIHEGQNAFLLS
ncbi:hypothetical protein M9Y10_044242 [Tritrichomonas musculus]|uniref:HECT-type E3 ubiquitin transferase n=1 Tax=Tritrichomonas musculus TaxID=1915356 RepID=A0ABR2K1Y9_9EUKA